MISLDEFASHLFKTAYMITRYHNGKSDMITISARLSSIFPEIVDDLTYGIGLVKIQIGSDGSLISLHDIFDKIRNILKIKIISDPDDTIHRAQIILTDEEMLEFQMMWFS